MIREKNGLAMSGTVTRSLRVLNVRRLLAAAFGEYPSCWTALSTRRLVVSVTFSGLLRTRETVAVDTSAAAATSRMVGKGASVGARVASIRELPATLDGPAVYLLRDTRKT